MIQSNMIQSNVIQAKNRRAMIGELEVTVCSEI